MNQSEIIQSLRAEIAKLQGVLDLLTDQPSDEKQTRRPGRPKASSSVATSFMPEEFAPKKRTMSAEGKARIAAAQKKRWATQKASTPDRKVGSQVSSTRQTSKKVPLKAATKIASAVAKKSAGKKSSTKTNGVSATKRASKQTGVTVHDSQASA